MDGDCQFASIALALCHARQATLLVFFQKWMSTRYLLQVFTCILWIAQAQMLQVADKFSVRRAACDWLQAHRSEYEAASQKNIRQNSYS